MLGRMLSLLFLLVLVVALPAADGQNARIERLIKQLDDDRFDVREAASEGLKKIGHTAEAALRRVLAGSPSAEVRQRIRDILDVAAPRYEGNSSGWYWVYGAIAHAQTFKATGDKIQSLELRVARLNLKQPAGALEVEIRDSDLKQIYARGLIAPEKSDLNFAWREVKWQRRVPLTPGTRYTMLFHSQDTANTAPWVVNAIYADLYPEGTHPGKIGHDFFFRIKYADGRVLHVGPTEETGAAMPINSGSTGGTVVQGALFIDGAGTVPTGKDAPDPEK